MVRKRMWPSLSVKWVSRKEKPKKRTDPSTTERERAKALECEVKELRRANEILGLVSAFFAQAELGRPGRFRVSHRIAR
jgi:transposase